MGRDGGFVMARYEYGVPILEPEYVSHGGLYLPEYAVPAPLPTCIDLFAGAGGFSTGMHKAGFHTLAASEAMHEAALTYLCNLGSPSTRVHVLPAVPGMASAKVQTWHEAHLGEVITAEEFFASGPARPNAPGDDRDWGPGDGWISTPPLDHEVGECADHTHEDGTPDVERREWFCSTYHAVPPHREPVEHLFLGDVRSLTGEQVLRAIGRDRGDVDAIVGGPPCQGFSKAGKRNVMDDRNSLVFDFARLVLEVWPKTFVMENVEGIASMVTADGIPVLDALARVFADGGFGAYDAMRRALHHQAGVALGGVRADGRGTKEKGKGTAEAEKQSAPAATASPQMALFSEGA